MADDLITSTQPGDVGNLLGDDIGGLDHYSSSHFQTEPLQPQPSAPQPMSATTNASKPLVDDFGFDSSHISTTTPSGGNSANPTGNSAAPNSSSSFTPGELSTTTISTHPVSVGDDDDYKENHHHPNEAEEGNHYHPDDDDDGDDGYDDREEELEELNYQTNYQDNPAFSDSDSPSEVHHHHPHPEAVREASPCFEPPVVHHQTNDAIIGGYESDEHDYNKYDYDDNDVEVEEQKDDHSAVDTQHPPHQSNNDDDEVDSLTEDNVDDLEEGHHVDDDDQLVYSTSPATNTVSSPSSSAVPTTEIIEEENPFETEPSPQPPSSSSPFMSSETPSPFSSSVAPTTVGADVLAAGPPEEKEAAASSPALYDLPEDRSPTLSPTVASANYAPPSPSAPPATSTFFPSPHHDDGDDDDAISAVTSQIITGDDDASGFAGADSDDDGRVSPTAAASTETMKTIDDLQMPSSPPLIPQPSAPPHPVVVESDHFSPPAPSSAPQPASSTLHNSHGARDNRNSFESESFTAEPNVVQTSPNFTDQPTEVQPKPTLEGPWLKNIDPKGSGGRTQHITAVLKSAVCRLASCTSKMENASQESSRVPYSVRKERQRQAKLAEEAKLAANKEEGQVAKKSEDTKAYVVEVQIPVTPEPIILQSKSPFEECAVLSFNQPAAVPEPVIDNRPAQAVDSVETALAEVIQASEPEHVVVKEALPAEPEPVEEKLVTKVDSTVVEAIPSAQTETVAITTVSSIQIESVAVEEPSPVVQSVIVPVEAPPRVQAELIMAAPPAQTEPIAVMDTPPAEPEVDFEQVESPVQDEIIQPTVKDEVLATPIISEEVISASPTVVAEESAPSPKVEEAPPAPVEEENIELIPASVRQKVLDLIYWRDVKKTGVVFGSMLFILLSLAIFSVLSVVAYLSLAILSVTLSFRVYKNIMQAVQKSGDGHPFKEYLEWELEMNDQKTQKVVKLVMKHFNTTVRELRRLFLVEDLVDSIKFGLLLWVLTYIGSWFNGMTLIINCVIIVFTLPKIYETNKVQIDNYLAMARSQFNKILQQVQSKLPFLKKKAKAQ